MQSLRYEQYSHVCQRCDFEWYGPSIAAQCPHCRSFETDRWSTGKQIQPSPTYTPSPRYPLGYDLIGTVILLFVLFLLGRALHV